jgi:hypothetical protein|tara:strand:+ start:1481 stop:1633 length:153 start_codon:yes stop_codon:yes gene_type:complete
MFVKMLVKLDWSAAHLIASGDSSLGLLLQSSAPLAERAGSAAALLGPVRI